jgi:hypothetical protein
MGRSDYYVSKLREVTALAVHTQDEMTRQTFLRAAESWLYLIELERRELGWPSGPAPQGASAP